MSRSGNDTDYPAGRRVWTIESADDDERAIRVHRHDHHELLWGFSGTRTIEVDGSAWIVPAALGLWIPAGVAHSGFVAANSRYRCTFFRPSPATAHLGTPQTVAIGPAWRGLASHLERPDLTPQARRRAEAVLIDLVEPVGPTTLPISMPSDERLVAIAAALLATPGDGRSLGDWGRRVGASTRTLTRRFNDETGMTFVEWRTQARIKCALVHLANGRPVATVAREVGFKTTSAFVRAFRAVTGRTPGAARGTACVDPPRLDLGEQTPPAAKMRPSDARPQSR